MSVVSISEGETRGATTEHRQTATFAEMATVMRRF